jgi:hypothetical protein
VPWTRLPPRARIWMARSLIWLILSVLSIEPGFSFAYGFGRALLSLLYNKGSLPPSEFTFLLPVVSGSCALVTTHPHPLRPDLTHIWLAYSSHPRHQSPDPTSTALVEIKTRVLPATPQFNF